MARGVKPEKPYPDFPLYAHACGKWAKKIDGKIVYFSTWSDHVTAHDEYLEYCKPKPVQPVIAITVRDAFNAFLTAKKKAVEAKSLSSRSWEDYKRTLKRLSISIGENRAIDAITQHDFDAYRMRFATTNNPVSVGNEITRIKTALKWLTKSKVCKQHEFGPDFRKPTALVARRHKRAAGVKLFEPGQILSLLDESGLRMRCMILLGINCAYHNSDCETLLLTQLKAALKTGIIEHARSKTEIERACPLWPETLEAAKNWIERRPDSKSDLAFVLPNGKPLSTTNADVAKRFRAVREAADIPLGGFSWLRKTFATYASESLDQVAVNFIMGHVDASTPGVYRQLIREKRLHKVTEHLRAWLFGS